jgi:hypothetical protein
MLSSAISMEILSPVRLWIVWRLDFALLTLSFDPGFWQYGFMDWEMFYNCLHMVVVFADWAVFQYNETAPERHGNLCPPNDELPTPGTYIILRPGICCPNLFYARLYALHYRRCSNDFRPDCCFVSSPPSNRLQHSFRGTSGLHMPDRVLNLYLQKEYYRKRIRERDPCCLISGLPVIRGDFSRFKAAHIFPRAHDIDVRSLYSI